MRRLSAARALTMQLLPQVHTRELYVQVSSLLMEWQVQERAREGRQGGVRAPAIREQLFTAAPYLVPPTKEPVPVPAATEPVLPKPPPWLGATLAELRNKQAALKAQTDARFGTVKQVLSTLNSAGTYPPGAVLQPAPPPPPLTQCSTL
jgi:hypothetical protein